MAAVKIIVTASRWWTDVPRLQDRLFRLADIARRAGESLTVVHGAARGGDSLASFWCNRVMQGYGSMGVEVVERAYPAQWLRLGKGAGPIRNRQMWTENWADTDLCLAFPTAQSRGTIDCMNLAREHDTPVWCIRPAPEPIPVMPAFRLNPAPQWTPIEPD